MTVPLTLSTFAVANSAACEGSALITNRQNRVKGIRRVFMIKWCWVDICLTNKSILIPSVFKLFIIYQHEAV